LRPALPPPAHQAVPVAGPRTAGAPVQGHQRGARPSRGRRRDATLMSAPARGPVLSQRRAGVLLPASSLCTDGEGALGWRARRFIDWLAEAGFTVWQLLPLVPVDASGSPYSARSDRAGNPALLDRDAPDPGNEDDFEAWRA